MKMNKNMLRIIVISAVILIVFSVIAFVIPIPKNGVFWISYCAGVFAIIAQIYVMYSAFKKGDSPRSKFYGWPVARVGTTYLVIQLAVSIISICLTKWIPFWIVLIVILLLLALAVIGFIAVDATRDEIERQDEELKKDVSAMREMQSKSRYIASQCNDAALKKDLEAFADEFRYSDPVSHESTREIEAEIGILLRELENMIIENDSAAASEMITKIKAQLNERNRICRLNK